MVGASKSGRTIDVVVLAAARLAVKRPKYFAAILPLGFDTKRKKQQKKKKKSARLKRDFPQCLTRFEWIDILY